MFSGSADYGYTLFSEEGGRHVLCSPGTPGVEYDIDIISSEVNVSPGDLVYATVEVVLNSVSIEYRDNKIEISDRQGHRFPNLLNVSVHRGLGFMAMPNHTGNITYIPKEEEGVVTLEIPICLTTTYDTPSTPVQKTRSSIEPEDIIDISGAELIW